MRRAHGTGEPAEPVRSAAHGDTFGSSGFYKNNDNNNRSNQTIRDISSPGSTIPATNKISKARWIWPGSAIIDQHYQMALEIEGNRTKFKKIREVFGEIPYFIIQRINADPLNFSSEISSELPISSAGTFFQKKYGISSSMESNTVKDSNVRGIAESNKTTQEKQEKPTFEEYRKTRPEATFDDYREVGRTPVTDWEPFPGGNMLVKKNAFGEVIDFLFLRKCGIHM